MKVLGAGLSKTGTWTLKVALDMLGLPCYHFGDVVVNYEKGDTDMWNDYMEKKSEMNWHKLYEGYEAATDVPSNLHFREIKSAFPDLKVILSTRDPDKWYASLADTVEKHNTNVVPAMFLPSFNGFQRAFNNSLRIAQVGELTRENAIAWMERHNAEVKKAIPPDRLLVYNVKEGWAPLCEFLGLPVPGEEFPWVNKDFADGEKLLQNTFIRDVKKMKAMCDQVLAQFEQTGS